MIAVRRSCRADTATLGVEARRHDQALRRVRRARRRVAEGRARHVPCAARRERRRQEHAGQMHHGLLPGRCTAKSWSTTAQRGDRQSARRARARTRHGLPAFHAGAGHDGRGKSRAGARRRAGRDRLGARNARSWRRSSPRMPFRVPLNAKVSAISAGERQKCEILKQLYLRAPLPHPRRADLGADAGRGRRGARHAARHGRSAATSPS